MGGKKYNIIPTLIVLLNACRKNVEKESALIFTPKKREGLYKKISPTGALGMSLEIG